jgi:hypothetical protein
LEKDVPSAFRDEEYIMQETSMKQISSKANYACYLTLKMEATCSSETLVGF